MIDRAYFRGFMKLNELCGNNPDNADMLAEAIESVSPEQLSLWIDVCEIISKVSASPLGRTKSALRAALSSPALDDEPFAPEPLPAFTAHQNEIIKNYRADGSNRVRVPSEVRIYIKQKIREGAPEAPMRKYFNLSYATMKTIRIEAMEGDPPAARAADPPPAAKSPVPKVGAGEQPSWASQPKRT